MRRLAVLLAGLSLFVPIAPIEAQTPQRSALIDQEVTIGLGEAWEQCVDVGAGTLYVRGKTLRVPLTERMRFDLSRAVGGYAVPLLVATAAPDETSSVHRVEAGTYCLRAGMSNRSASATPPPSGSMTYGVAQFTLEYEPL